MDIMNNVFERDFVYLYPVNNLSEVSKTIYVKGGKVTFKIIASFDGNFHAPASIPAGMVFRAKDDWTSIWTEREVQVSDIARQDFNAEAVSFGEKARQLLAAPKSDYDIVEWGFIADKNHSDEFIEFCESSAPIGILEHYNRFINYGGDKKTPVPHQYCVTKIPADEDKILLMARLLEDVADPSIQELQCITPERLGRRNECCIGCYLRTTRQVCLFQNSIGAPLYDVCEDEGRLMVLDEEEVYRCIQDQVGKRLGLFAQDDPDKFDKLKKLFWQVKRTCDITLDDIKDIMADKDEWIRKKADSLNFAI